MGKERGVCCADSHSTAFLTKSKLCPLRCLEVLGREMEIRNELGFLQPQQAPYLKGVLRQQCPSLAFCHTRKVVMGHPVVRILENWLNIGARGFRSSRTPSLTPPPHSKSYSSLLPGPPPPRRPRPNHPSLPSPPALAPTRIGCLPGQAHTARRRDQPTSHSEERHGRGKRAAKSDISVAVGDRRCLFLMLRRAT